MNKYFASAMIAMSAFTSISAADILEKMPTKFTVTERPYSWVPTLDIATDQFKLGKVYRKFVNPNLEYEFRDFGDNLLVKTRMRWIQKSPEFDLFDAQDKLIGIVEERLFTFFPTFDIVSPIGERLAAGKLNFFGNVYKIYDPVSHIEMATLSRPFISLRSFWTLEMLDEPLFSQKGLPPAVFVLVMSFQTDRDNWQNDPLITYAEKKDTSSLRSMQPLNAKTHTKGVNWGLLKRELESYSALLAKVEPTEADFQATEAYADAYLADRDRSFETQEARVAAGLRELMPLLKGDALTEAQKSALFMNMKAMIDLQ